MLEWVAEVISAFAAPSYVCGRCIPVSGKRADQNRKKKNSFIGKHVKKGLTLPRLCEDHSTTNSTSSQSIQLYLVLFPADKNHKCVKAMNSLAAVSR